MGSYTSTSKEISSSVPLGSDSKDPGLNDVNLDLWEVVNALKRKGFNRLTNRYGVSMDLEEACDMVLPILRSMNRNQDSDEEPTDFDSVCDTNYGQMKRKLVDQNSTIEALKEENRVLGQKVGSLEAAVRDALKRESTAANQMTIERKAKEELRSMHQVKDLELLRKIKRFNTSLEVDLMPWSYKSRSPSDGSFESSSTPRQSPSPRGGATAAAAFVIPARDPSASVAARKKGRGADVNDRTSGTELNRKSNKDRVQKTYARNGSESVENGGSRKDVSSGCQKDPESRSRTGFRNGSENPVTPRIGAQSGSRGVDNNQSSKTAGLSYKGKNASRKNSEKAKKQSRNGIDDAKTGSEKGSENSEKHSENDVRDVRDARTESRLSSADKTEEDLSLQTATFNPVNLPRNSSYNAENLYRSCSGNSDNLTRIVSSNSEHLARKGSSSLSRTSFHYANAAGSRNSSENTEIPSRNASQLSGGNVSQNRSSDSAENGSSRSASRNDLLARGTEMELAAEAHSSLQLLPVNWCSSEYNLEEEIARTVCTKVQDCSVTVKDCPAIVKDCPVNVKDCPAIVKDCPAIVKDCPANVNDCTANISDHSSKITADDQPKISSKDTYKPAAVTESPFKGTLSGQIKVRSWALKFEENESKMKATLELQSDAAAGLASSSTGVRQLDTSSTLRTGDARTEETPKVGRLDIGQRWNMKAREQSSTRDDVRPFVVANRKMTPCLLSHVVGSSGKVTQSSKVTPSAETRPISQTTYRLEVVPSTAWRYTEAISQVTPSSQATPCAQVTPPSETTPISDGKAISETPPASETTPVSNVKPTPSGTTPSSDNAPIETGPSRGNVNNSDTSDTLLTGGRVPAAGQAVSCREVSPWRAGKRAKISNKINVTEKTSSSGVSPSSRTPTRPAVGTKAPATVTGTPKSVLGLASGPSKDAPPRKDIGQYSGLQKSAIRWANRSGGTAPVQRTPKRAQSPAKPLRKVSASPSLSYTKLSARDCTPPTDKNTESSRVVKPFPRDDETVLPRPNDDEDTTEVLDVPASKADPSPSSEVPCPISVEQPSSEVVGPPELAIWSAPQSKRRHLLQPSTMERNAKQPSQLRKDGGAIGARINNAKNSIQERSTTTTTKTYAKQRLVT